MQILTRRLLRLAQVLAQEISARALLVNADVIAHDEELRQLLKAVTFPVILIRRDRGSKSTEFELDNCSECHSIFVPDVHMTRTGQVKVALLLCLAKGFVTRRDCVVCLSGIDHSGSLDTIFTLNLGTERELLSGPNTIEIQGDFQVEVFQRVLSLATELGVEGREGRPVGTVFVIGDSERVLSQSRQLVLNPFQGYEESTRNVLDSRLEETVKEFSAIDGAFLIRGDGVLLSAGTQLMSKSHIDGLPSGLGTRHAAAAAITASTDAVAIAISQSTGTVSVFKCGQMIMDIHKPSNGVRLEP